MSDCDLDLRPLWLIFIFFLHILVVQKSYSNMREDLFLTKCAFTHVSSYYVYVKVNKPIYNEKVEKV